MLTCYSGQFEELKRRIGERKPAVLLGDVRSGKTTLALKAAGESNSLKLLYVSMTGVKSPADFCFKVVRAVCRLNSERTFLVKLADLLLSLRPTLSLENGVAALTLDFRSADNLSAVEVVMDMLGLCGMPLCVVFDDVHEIVDSSFWKIFKRAIDSYSGRIPFAIVGSGEKLRDSFGAAIEMPSVPTEGIISLLKEKWPLLPDDACLEIAKATGNVLGDAFEFAEAMENASGIEDAYQKIFRREAREYRRILRPLTDIQTRILVEIARSGGDAVCGRQFMTKANVPNPSSVRKSVLRMVDFGILLQSGNDYRIDNPFFAEWLRRLQ